MDLDFETEFHGAMKNTEKAWKLKRIAEEMGKKAIDTAWQSKPLHSQYPFRSQKADVDLHDTLQWLRGAALKAETNGFIQGNILHNGADPRCKFCNTSTETIDHLMSVRCLQLFIQFARIFLGLSVKARMRNWGTE